MSVDPEKIVRLILLLDPERHHAAFGKIACLLLFGSIALRSDFVTVQPHRIVVLELVLKLVLDASFDLIDWHPSMRDVQQIDAGEKRLTEELVIDDHVFGRVVGVIGVDKPEDRPVLVERNALLVDDYVEALDADARDLGARCSTEGWRNTVS